MNRIVEWWRVQVYGSLTPSRGQRIVAAVVAGCFLLVAYAVWTDFVPSAMVATVGIYLSAVVSLTLILFHAHGIATHRFEWEGVPGMRSRLLTYVLVFVGTYCFAWLILVRAVPDILTRVFGTYESKSLILEASYAERRKQCDHQLRGEELAFPGYLCVPVDQVGRFAPLGEVILSGPSSALGLHVSLIEPGRQGK